MGLLNKEELIETAVWTFIAGLLLAELAAWALINQHSFYLAVQEDAFLDAFTAWLFGLSSIGFVIIAWRSRFLKTTKGAPRYLFVLAWALLMFLFMGEEISWGQRIFGIATPEWLSRINMQDEFSVHNLTAMENTGGGSHRYLSFMMLMTGLFIPLFARTPFGKRVIQWWAFPVCPIQFWLFFVGAYAFGLIMRNYTQAHNDSAEAREFIMSAGMVCFAFYGAYSPESVFLWDDSRR